jgi:hypothetical protein
MALAIFVLPNAAQGLECLLLAFVISQFTGVNMRSKVTVRGAVVFVLAVLALVLFALPKASAQETTGGIQGTVKDSTGAVVPNAQVALTGTKLVGGEATKTNSVGYYSFQNLPPGTYELTVTATGFQTLKRPGLDIQVGSLPTVDLTLQLGTASTTVEVTSAPPMIDVTTTSSITSVTQNVIQNVPHGISYQSVIQFAPSARNEPLMGNTMQSNGTGGAAPGSTTNGLAYGYSIGGASDSENSYLVDGLETANLIGGYSHTDIPFDFIQEVSLKTSGVEAQYGGSLGGVVNAITKSGSNNWHGSGIFQFENDAMNGSPTPIAGYLPGDNGTPTSWGNIDPAYLAYQPKRDSGYLLNPGFTLGGPILKNRLWFFAGFNPEFAQTSRTVNFTASSPNPGLHTITSDTHTYYTLGRLDAAVTDNIRVFGSWYYTPQHVMGEFLPQADPVQAGVQNFSADQDLSVYAHSLGYYAPASATTTGVDFIITPSLVASTRFGWYFENYHDYGLPTNGNTLIWQNDGTTGTDALGNPLPASLRQLSGYANTAFAQNYTHHNADKHLELTEVFSWIKSGWAGTHNFKFGYELNRASNNILQGWNQPTVYMYPGATFSPQTSVGPTNCAPFVTLYGACEGLYGYVSVEDFATGGQAISYNHSFFAQDAWNIGKGLTINVGVRVEKENLPAENQPKGGTSNPISFGWGDKIAPRIGAAWDVFQNGKMKIFGDYGVFNDTMKLNLAISSMGGQYWNECFYALDTSNLSDINPVFNAQGRDCSGDISSGANFPGGTTPAGLTFLENENQRGFATTCATCSPTYTGIVPNLKPYRQHEFDLGVEYQITPTLAFSARYDRRRLDHAIEDGSIYNPSIGETFVIMNPGQGVARSFDSFYSFLYNTPSGCTPTSTPSCPNNIPAQRDYDGIEFRLDKSFGHNWFGMFSYTWSRLWGNYSGLTSSDLLDGGGGRNSPNNSRAFDEPYFLFSSYGKSSSGPLNTDRPNTFKGYGYYSLKEGSRTSTDFGVFQYFYQGSPTSTITNVGYSVAPNPLFFQYYSVYVVGRGKYVNVTQDPTTGAITLGNPYTKRTPWYINTDLNLTQNFKVSEGKSLSFSVTFRNLFNQHSVTAYANQIDSNKFRGFLFPGGTWIVDGPAFYSAAENPYNLQDALNTTPTGETLNSSYGKPYLWQLSRNIRMALRFTF